MRRFFVFCTICQTLSSSSADFAHFHVPSDSTADRVDPSEVFRDASLEIIENDNFTSMDPEILQLIDKVIENAHSERNSSPITAKSDYAFSPASSSSTGPTSADNASLVSARRSYSREYAKLLRETITENPMLGLKEQYELFLLALGAKDLSPMKYRTFCARATPIRFQVGVFRESKRPSVIGREIASELFKILDQNPRISVSDALRELRNTGMDRKELPSGKRVAAWLRYYKTRDGVRKKKF